MNDKELDVRRKSFLWNIGRVARAKVLKSPNLVCPSEEVRTQRVHKQEALGDDGDRRQLNQVGPLSLF